MSNRIKYKGNIMTPGSVMIYTNLEREIFAGEWGFGDPRIGNMRIENWRERWQKYLNSRGILEIEGFWLNASYYHASQALKIPVVYNENYDFCMLTKKAKAPIVKDAERQFIFIKEGNEEAWLDKGQIHQIDNMTLIRERIIKEAHVDK